MARQATCTRLRLTVLVFEDVEDGEDLPVVGHQRFSHQVGRHHQVLQDLQGGADHLAVSGVQGVCGGKERRGWSKTEAASMGPLPAERKKNHFHSSQSLQLHCTLCRSLHSRFALDAPKRKFKTHIVKQIKLKNTHVRVFIPNALDVLFNTIEKKKEKKVPQR